jgi:hypothetical protein
MASLFQTITAGDWATGNKYVAPSDGFVLCFVKNPPDGGKGCIGWAYAWAKGTYAQVTGGNMGFFGKNWTECMCMAPQSCLLPVAAGDTFYVGMEKLTWQYQEADPPITFYWISLTGQSCGDPVPASRSADPDFQPPPLPQPTAREAGEGEDLAAILEELIGKPIDTSMRKRIAALRL